MVDSLTNFLINHPQVKAGSFPLFLRFVFLLIYLFSVLAIGSIMHEVFKKVTKRGHNALIHSEYYPSICWCLGLILLLTLSSASVVSVYNVGKYYFENLTQFGLSVNFGTAELLYLKLVPSENFDNFNLNKPNKVISLGIIDCGNKSIVQCLDAIKANKDQLIAQAGSSPNQKIVFK